MRKKIIRIFFGILVILIYVLICICTSKDYKTSHLKERFDKVSINSSNVSSVKGEDEYYARVVIPKIGVNQYLYPVGSSENTVDKNIEIIKGSSLPDQVSGNLILAAHNGISPVAYFHDLNKLEIGDLIDVSYGGIDYEYIVSYIYDVKKTGKVSIKRDKTKTSITLITCLGEDRQLVVIGYLR